MPWNGSEKLMRSALVFENSEKFARAMDEKDALFPFHTEFHIPRLPNGDTSVYLAGNSLGLQPKKVREYIEQELGDWVGSPGTELEFAL